MTDPTLTGNAPTQGKLLSFLRWIEAGGFAPLLVCLVLLQMIKAPLSASLWLDETLTQWVSSGTFDEVWSRAIVYQGMSPLYFLLVWVWTKVAGTGELALRVPTILAFGGFLGALYFLARRLFGATLALLCVLVVLSHDLTLKTAFQARPYAFALCSLTLSVLLLQIWIDSRRFAVLVGAGFFLAITFYFQYLYLFAFILHGILAANALRSAHLTPSDMVRLLATWACVVISLVPGGLHLASLAERSTEIEFAPAPTLFTLLNAIMPMYWCVFLVVASAVTYINVKVATDYGKAREPGLVLFTLTWWLLPPLLFFLVSQKPSSALFVDRYYAWCVPGFAFAIAMLTSRFVTPARGMMLASIVVLIFVREGGRRWMTEDWREAARFISDAKPGMAFVYTGLIESEVLEGVSQQEAYLKAPMLVYPPGAPYIVVPSQFTREELKQWFEQELRKAPRPLMLVAARNRRPGADGTWVSTTGRFEQVLAAQGLRLSKIWPTDQVAAIEIYSIEN